MKRQMYRFGAVATVLFTVLSLGVTVVRAAAPGAWYAEYYANRDLAGGPAVTRHEDRLHF